METIKFTAQMYSLKIDRNGGGKITLEFGTDALPEIQRLTGLGDCNIAIAAVPYQENRRGNVLETGEISFP